MNVKLVTALLAAALAAVLLAGRSARAQASVGTTWNVCAVFSGTYIAQSITFNYTLVITSEDFQAGTFTGTFTSGSTVAINGTIDGSSLVFDIPGLGGFGGQFSGQIQSDGSMGGTMWYENTGGQWFGTWSATPQKAFNGLPGLAVQPNPIFGGQTGTGAVSFDSLPAAPGVTVSLHSSNAIVSVPSSVTVGPNQAWAFFSFTTQQVLAERDITITASYTGDSGPVVETVTVAVLPTISSLTLANSTIAAGTQTTMTMVLPEPAPAGGLVAVLGTTNGKIANSQYSVAIPAGSTTATVTVLSSSPLAATTQVTLYAIVLGGTRAVVLTVTP